MIAAPGLAGCASTETGYTPEQRAALTAMMDAHVEAKALTLASGYTIPIPRHKPRH